MMEESLGNQSIIVLENNLQALLEDEKDRGEQHKRNYQRIKTDHNRLKDEQKKLQHAMQELSSNLQKSQEASQQALQSAQTALHNKQKELQSFKQKLEAANVQGEIGSQNVSNTGENVRHEEQIHELESECETLRHEANRLKHLHNMLIAQSQFDLLKTKRKTKEMHTRHAIQLQAVEEVNKYLGEESQNISSREEELRILERENINLKSRIRSLLSEQESLRSYTEESIAKSEAKNKDHLKASLTQVTSLRDMQSENRYLKLQKEALTEQLTTCHKECLVLKSQCLSLQKDLSHAKNLLANSEYEKVELTEQLKAKFVEELGQISAEKEAVLSELNSVGLQLKLSQEAFSKQITRFKEMDFKWHGKFESAMEEQKQLQETYKDNRSRLEKELEVSVSRSDRVEAKYKDVIRSLERTITTLEKEKQKTFTEIDSLRNHVQKYESDLGKAQRLHLQLDKKYTELEVESEQLKAQISSQTTEMESQAEENRLQLQKLSSLMQQNTRNQQIIKDLKSKKKLSQKNTVNGDEHRRVKDSLQDLQKKHHLFRTILSSSIPE